MNIYSANFIKGIVKDDEILFSNIPQVAFIGRSNVGKSSVINSLANRKDLAHSSNTPGRTRQINFYLIKSSGAPEFYLVDLPGYGFAKGSRDEKAKIQELIYWYLAHPDIEQKKVVLIVDANVGVTETDSQMLNLLQQHGKTVIVVANKIDKLNSSEVKKQLRQIEDKINPAPSLKLTALPTARPSFTSAVSDNASGYLGRCWVNFYKVIPYSAEKKMGVSELSEEILK